MTKLKARLLKKKLQRSYSYIFSLVTAVIAAIISFIVTVNYSEPISALQSFICIGILTPFFMIVIFIALVVCMFLAGIVVLIFNKIFYGRGV